MALGFFHRFWWPDHCGCMMDSSGVVTACHDTFLERIEDSLLQSQPSRQPQINSLRNLGKLEQKKLGHSEECGFWNGFWLVFECFCTQKTSMEGQKLHRYSSSLFSARAALSLSTGLEGWKAWKVISSPGFANFGWFCQFWFCCTNLGLTGILEIIRLSDFCLFLLGLS